jgi:predicted transposase/invertase (TIGR01784 family)
MSKKLIRFDWAIKRLLRNKANFVVLEGFLSELLFENIIIEKILESESNQETDNDKYNRVDILTQNSKNELIIIEIQSSYEIDYFQRMAYGVSKSISENLHLGQRYSEIKKVIAINIVYFDLGQGQDYIYSGKTEENLVQEITKQVEIPNCNYIVLAMVARDIESRYYSCSAKVHNSEKPEIIINHLSRRHEMQYIRKAGNYGLKSHSTEIAATRSAIKLMEIDQKVGGPK